MRKWDELREPGVAGVTDFLGTKGQPLGGWDNAVRSCKSSYNATAAEKYLVYIIK